MSVLEPPPGTDTVEEVEEAVVHVERPPMGKWGAAGMPLERSKDFKTSSSRLLARLRKLLRSEVCGPASDRRCLHHPSAPLATPRGPPARGAPRGGERRSPAPER